MMLPNVLPLNCGPLFRHAEMKRPGLLTFHPLSECTARRARCSNGLLGATPTLSEPFPTKRRAL